MFFGNLLCGAALDFWILFKAIISVVCCSCVYAGFALLLYYTYYFIKKFFDSLPFFAPLVIALPRIDCLSWVSISFRLHGLSWRGFSKEFFVDWLSLMLWPNSPSSLEVREMIDAGDMQVMTGLKDHEVMMFWLGIVVEINYLYLLVVMLFVRVTA